MNDYALIFNLSLPSLSNLSLHESETRQQLNSPDSFVIYFSAEKQIAELGRKLRAPKRNLCRKTFSPTPKIWQNRIPNAGQDSLIVSPLIFVIHNFYMTFSFSTLGA